MSQTLRKAGIELTAKGSAEFKREMSGIASAVKSTRLELSKNMAMLGDGATKVQKYNASLKQLGSALDLSKDKTEKFKTRQKELQQALSEMPKKIDEAKNKLKETESQYSKNSREIEKQKKHVQELATEYGKGSSEYKKANAELKELEKANREVKQEIKTHKDAVNELTVTEQQWQKELRSSTDEITKAETQTYKLRNEINKLQAEYRESGGRFADTAQKVKDVGSSFNNVGEKAEKLGGSLTKGVTLPLAGALTFVSKKAIEFEDAFTGVVKTVDAPKEKLEQLKQAFIDMSKEMPITASELAGIGEAAGQLGIQTENIEGFTRTVAMLGVTTNLSSEQAATELARFMNVMGTSQTNIDRLGSTIVALGNNFATTESEISAMAQRLSGAGKLVGMTEADVLALAAAMSSVGIEAEAGGSAMSAIIKKMYNASQATKNYHEELAEASRTMNKTDFKKFKKELDKNARAMQTLAETSGVSVEEFASLLERRPVEALEKFVKGMANAKGEGENLNDLLKDIGVKGLRESDAILKLAGATELTGQAMDVANKAWSENNALQKEASTRFETTTSKMQVAKNKIDAQAISIGNKLLPKIADLLEKSQPLIDVIGKLIDGFANLDTNTQLLVLGAGPLISLFGKITKGIGGTIGSIGSLIQWFGKITTPKALIDTTTALEAMPGSASLAGSAVSLFTNPWVLGIGAVVAAVGGIGYLIYKEMTKDEDNHKKAVERTQGKYQDWFDAVTEGAKKAADSQTQVQDSTRRTGETYEEMAARIKKQNTEIQKSIQATWDDQTDFSNYDYESGTGLETKEGVGSKLKKLGITGEELEQIRASWESYGTILANHQTQLFESMAKGKAVTTDMVNSTIIANEAVIGSILERYQKERDESVTALEEKKTRLLENQSINQQYRDQEIAAIDEQLRLVTESYTSKETLVRETEGRINQIMSTASVEKRTLTAEEVVELVSQYKILENEVGLSMSNNREAQDLLSQNLTALTTNTALNMLEQKGIIGSVTRENIANFENQEDKVNALHDALIAYNNQNVESKRINVDTSDENKVHRLRSSIESIPRRRDVTIGVHQAFTQSGPVATTHATGGNLAMFARGGNIQPTYAPANNFMGIVGEAGPEVVQFSKRGVHITPLSTREKMRGISGVLDDNKKGASENVINVNIYNPIVKEDMNIKTLTEQVGRELITTLNRHNFMTRGV